MNKKNLILGGILLCLVAFTWLWNGPVRGWQDKKNKEGNFLSALSLEKADSISIYRAGASTTLEKVADGWRVGGTKGFFAKKEVIDELSFAIDKVAKGDLELVSTNKDKKSGFGVGDDGIKVVIRQEGLENSFVVGNATANFDGSYLSRSDADKTWKVGVDLSAVFSRGEWRDDSILSFIKERAGKVRFQYPNRQFIVEKKENKWNGIWPGKGFKVSDDKVNAVLAVLENLKAAKIPAQDFKAFGAPEKNGIIIQVTGEQLDETLMIGNCTKENLCYAKKGSNDNIYMITKEQRDALNKQTRDLR
jgi:hypothetical protein